MQPLLELRGVKAAYGSTQVVHGVDLSLAAGERLGLFGPNGHGKTTLLRIVSGLLKPTAGEIRFDGRPIGGESPGRLVARGLIHVPQANRLFPALTVLECLKLAAAGRGSNNRTPQLIDRVVALFPKLGERRHQLCRTLSGGERQMVAIGVGLMGEPRLLLLDEPTLGLAPRVKDELCDAIGKIVAEGLPLIIVEQDVEFLLALTDRLVMINHGTVQLEVASSLGLDRERIMRMYVGHE